MHYSIFLLALMLPLQSFAETAQCQFSESECEALSHYQESDQELNQIYQRVMGKIHSNEFEEYLVPKEEIQQSLQNAQRAWLQYRDSHCEAYYRLFGGGTSRNVDRLFCLRQMTIERTILLQKVYLDGDTA